MSKFSSPYPFILTPLFPALYAALSVYIIDSGSLGYSIVTFVLYYFFSGLTVFSIGMPTLFLARFVWKITWYIALIGGFVDGIIAYAIFFKFNIIYINNILNFGIMGAGSGLVFWLASKKYGSTIID